MPTGEDATVAGRPAADEPTEVLRHPPDDEPTERLTPGPDEATEVLTPSPDQATEVLGSSPRPPAGARRPLAGQAADRETDVAWPVAAARPPAWRRAAVIALVAIVLAAALIAVRLVLQR